MKNVQLTEREAERSRLCCFWQDVFNDLTDLKLDVQAVMKEIYAEFFLSIKGIKGNIDINKQYAEITKQIALDGKIDKVIEILQKYLNNLSNRDFQKFDEKYIKLIFYCLAMNL